MESLCKTAIFLFLACVLFCPAESQTQCPRKCRPRWVGQLKKYSTTTDVATREILQRGMCDFASENQLFGSCTSMASQCPTNVVQFHCCPTECVRDIKACLKRNQNFVCIPSSLQPWNQKLLQWFKGIKKNLQQLTG